MNFIYVFSEDVKQQLIALGFVLLKADTQKGVYIFKNDPCVTSFGFAAGSYAFSNTLTF